MRKGTWLALIFAGAVVFVAGCVAAPQGGYAKKGGGLAYAQEDAYGSPMVKKRSARRMKSMGGMVAAEEPAPEEPAPAARPAPVETAAPAGLRLCLSAAAQADSKTAYVMARDFGVKPPAFQSVHVSEGSQEGCDVVATIAGRSAAAVSVHTRKPLFSGHTADESLEGSAAELTSQLYDAFKKGSALCEQVLAERSGGPAASEAAPKAAPVPERKPLSDAEKKALDSQL
ncbi:MAG: hypothetical protein HY926_01235 [Elusimicrobia bacterium]|nr:hypothetical protein [Elusimicrobiota bacterium]